MKKNYRKNILGLLIVIFYVSQDLGGRLDQQANILSSSSADRLEDLPFDPTDGDVEETDLSDGEDLPFDPTDGDVEEEFGEGIAIDTRAESQGKANVWPFQEGNIDERRDGDPLVQVPQIDLARLKQNVGKSSKNPLEKEQGEEISTWLDRVMRNFSDVEKILPAEWWKNISSINFSEQEGRYNKASYGLQAILEYKTRYPDRYDPALALAVIKDSNLKRGDVRKMMSYAFWDAVISIQDLELIKWLVSRDIETEWDEDGQFAQYRAPSLKIDGTAHGLVQKKLQQGKITEDMSKQLIKALEPEPTA